MSRTPRLAVLLLLAFSVFLSPAAIAQQKSPSPHVTDSKAAKAVKPAAQLPLQTVTLVSTEEAARKAAEEASARARSSETPGETPKPAKASEAADGAVLEFHPTENLPGKDAAKVGVQQKDRSKSVLKNIHGSAYGAAASAAGRVHGEGGEVGADTRGGKLNIYVEGERSHASTPVPH